MISKALEEYIKTMYVLKQQNTEIRVTDIATKMNCSKASVTKSLNSLKEKGLVNYEAYGKIELTVITPPKIAKRSSHLPKIARVPNKPPKAREPVSPINTFAGWKFHTKKPSVPPANAAERIPISK